MKVIRNNSSWECHQLRLVIDKPHLLHVGHALQVRLVRGGVQKYGCPDEDMSVATLGVMRQILC